MRCEDCQSRLCLSNGGFCIETYDRVRQRLEQLRDSYTSYRQEPPTQKQIDCINRWIVLNDFDCRRPEAFTKKAYFEFIRDVIVVRRGPADLEDDPDFLNWVGAYQNDVWCEEY